MLLKNVIFFLTSMFSPILNSLHIIYHICLERSYILIENPYIGMPINLGNACINGCNNDHMDDCLDDFPLAMAYVPFQKWQSTYSPEKALQRGTLFPQLDLPFRGGMKP